MSDHLDRYCAVADPFGSLVVGLQDEAWDHPSPCDGWTARDVLDHVVTTQREFLAGHGVDLGPVPALAVDPAAGWAAHDGAVRRVVADSTVMDLGYDGFFGPTTVGATLLDFYGWDLLVHRWDIARAAGRDERFTEAELDVVDALAQGFGPGLYQEGVCRPALDAPADADRQTQVLARLGRRG